MTNHTESIDLPTLRRYYHQAQQCQDLPAALREIEQAVAQAQREENRRAEAAAWYRMGVYRDQHKESRLAVEAFQKSLSLWTEDDELLIATTLERMGGAFSHLGHNHEGLPYEERALALYQKHGDRQGEAALLNNLAVTYKEKGDVARAQEMLHRCLEYFVSENLRTNIALTSLNIANNYNVLEDGEQAIPFARRGVEFLEEANDTGNLPFALCILGTAFVKQGSASRLQDALSTFERALAIAEGNGIDSTTAILLGDLGDVLMRLERFKEAEAALHRAVDLYRAEGSAHNPGMGEALSRLGALYANPAFSQHDDVRALSALLEAAALCEESDTAIVLVSIYATLTDVYERMDQPRDALLYSRKLRDTERRLFNERSDQRIRSLQVHFAVEQAKKDAEIAHLRSVELANALTETEQLRHLAEERARTDVLTGVANRRSLEEFLREEIRRADRYQRELSVALVDVDHFKRVNDGLGHGVGDIVLREVAALLRTGCREGSGDHVARYGGEEFVVVLPETDYDDALTQCERLRARIADAHWPAIAPGLETVTISIGLATAPRTNPQAAKTDGQNTLSSEIEAAALTMYDILALADKNLYHAKRGGRNRVVGTPLVMAGSD